MEYIYDALTYKDPARRLVSKRAIPGLKTLEQRMYLSLMRSPGKYVRKKWLFSKSSERATILIGTRRYNPMSGDVSITFEIKVITF